MPRLFKLNKIAIDAAPYPKIGLATIKSRVLFQMLILGSVTNLINMDLIFSAFKKLKKLLKYNTFYELYI